MKSAGRVSNRFSVWKMFFFTMTIKGLLDIWISYHELAIILSH